MSLASYFVCTNSLCGNQYLALLESASVQNNLEPNLRFFYFLTHNFSFWAIKLGHCIACTIFLNLAALKLNFQNQKLSKNKDW